MSENKKAIQKLEEALEDLLFTPREDFFLHSSQLEESRYHLELDFNPQDPLGRQFLSCQKILASHSESYLEQLTREKKHQTSKLLFEVLNFNFKPPNHPLRPYHLEHLNSLQWLISQSTNHNLSSQEVASILKKVWDFLVSIITLFDQDQEQKQHFKDSIIRHCQGIMGGLQSWEDYLQTNDTKKLQTASYRWLSSLENLEELWLSCSTQTFQNSPTRHKALNFILHGCRWNHLGLNTDVSTEQLLSEVWQLLVFHWSTFLSQQATSYWTIPPQNQLNLHLRRWNILSAEFLKTLQKSQQELQFHQEISTSTTTLIHSHIFELSELSDKIFETFSQLYHQPLCPICETPLQIHPTLLCQKCRIEPKELRDQLEDWEKQFHLLKPRFRQQALGQQAYRDPQNPWASQDQNLKEQEHLLDPTAFSLHHKNLQDLSLRIDLGVVLCQWLSLLKPSRTENNYHQHLALLRNLQSDLFANFQTPKRDQEGAYHQWEKAQSLITNYQDRLETL